jgi:hypothetical protein
LHRGLAFWALLLTFIATGCGGRPRAGDACQASDKSFCVDNMNLLYCYMGKWKNLSCTKCSGPDGPSQCCLAEDPALCP